MSTPTVTRETFEIREGLTGRGTATYRYIDGVVGGQTVIGAIESLGHRNSVEDGPAVWLMVTYPDVAHFVGAAHPSALPITEDQAREWVSFFAAMYAKAAEAAVSL